MQRFSIDWPLEKWHHAAPGCGTAQPNRRIQWRIKRSLDWILAAIGVVLMSPLLLAIAIAVRVSSPGPILFVQERLGQYGQPFYIYKFRTMVDGAVHMGAGFDTFEGDPRVTSVGKFLREYHLDELPQLFNVLRGEMSLVGPRPLLMSSLATYSEQEMRRLLVPPGITAWEAVQGGLLNTIDERLALDLWYVDHWTLWLDAWILMKTVPVVLTREGVYGENGSERGRETPSG